MPRGMALVLASAFVFVAASALMFAGCQQQKLPVSASGQPVVQFRPAEQVHGLWHGDIIVADTAVAQGVTYQGDGADGLVKGEVVDVAWPPGTLTVVAVQKGSAQWWYMGGALLYILAIIMEEVGRRQMSDARARAGAGKGP